MAERVVGVGFSVEWDPNAPEAVMISNDLGRTVLALRAHPDDTDERSVALVWNGVASAALSAPNDEAISGHRLWRHGLSEVLWMGVVVDSALRSELERQNAVHPGHDPARFQHLEHYIVLLKECVAEVVAMSVEVHRIDGETLEAATAALG
jgi:hypothetical protein